MTEFYIGQIFEDIYPPEAASWCNSNNAKIVELDPIEKEFEGVLETIRVFEIVEIEPYIPTVEDISRLREYAYVKEVDVLHAQKMRKTILGTWTEEDEANYIAEVKRLSEDIANRYPYPEETITKVVEEQLELPLEV